VGTPEIGNRAFRRALDELGADIADLKKAGGTGLVTVNEPEPGQVLSVNGDGEFEWVAPESGGDARFIPRVINLYVNSNGEILDRFTNGEEGVEVLQMGTGLYRVVYSIPFPEPEPGAVSPPYLSVTPSSFKEEVGEEEIVVVPVPTIRTDTGETHNGGAFIELHRMDTGEPVDANFHFIAIGE
jgi:hypothetical protein